jgi:hypothetical protein
MRTSATIEEARERGFKPLYALCCTILLLPEMPYPLSQGVSCAAHVFACAGFFRFLLFGFLRVVFAQAAPVQLRWCQKPRFCFCQRVLLDAQSCSNQKMRSAVGFSFVCVFASFSWWSFVAPLLFLLPRPVFFLFFPFLGCLSVASPRGLCLQPFGFRFSSVSSGLLLAFFPLSAVCPLWLLGAPVRVRANTKTKKKNN